MERISEAYKNEPTASQKNAVFDAMLGYFEGEMPAGFEHGGADMGFSSDHWDYGLTDEYSIRVQTPDGIPGDAHFFSFARSQPSVVNALASAGYSEEDIEERSLSHAYVGYDYVELYLSVPRALAGGVFFASSPGELADVLEREFGVRHLRDGFRGWVFPDGTPVSVPEGGNHKSLARWIADHVDYGGMRIPSTSGDGSPFVEDEIGGIRVNLAGEDYVRLNGKEPTREQYDALGSVFGLGRGISIHFPYGDTGEGHSTAIKSDPSKGAEYYMRLIRRFYSSGEYPRDYESLSRGKVNEAESAEEDSRGRPLSQGQASFFRNSMIRDRKGRLLACYHSTNHDFDQFDYKHSGTNGGLWGEGFYFSTKDDFIYAYGDKYVEAYLNVENPWVIGADLEKIRDLVGCFLGKEPDRDYLNELFSKGYGDIYVVENAIEAERNKHIPFKKVLEKCGYDGIIVGDPNDLGRYEDEIVVFRPNQIKRTSNADPSSSNRMSEFYLAEKGLKEAKSLGEGDFGHRVKAWRVGKGDKGFYALDPEYYSHSITGYRSGDACAVFLDLSGTKVFRPMREWGLYADTWAVIRRKNGDSSEFFEEKGVFYDEPYDGGEGFTDTDSLAQWGEENGYDAVVLEGIPGDQGYGPEFDEVYVANPEKVVVGRLSESTKVYGGIRMTESPYEVKNALNSAADEIKVLYDPRKRLYLYGKANDFIHNEMLEKAWEAGYYPELNRWELPEYVEKLDSNCLVYLWFIPGGDDEGRTIGVDDYTEEWVYPNGILCARSHYSETPLYDQTFDLPRVLGKPKAIYAIKDWETMEPQRLDLGEALGEPHSANESYLTEKTRQQLLDKSRNGAAYAPDNRAKGRNRYERRKYSKVAATIKDYNSIDMNAFFKGDYLEFGVPVHGETDDYVVTVTFERILPRLQQEVRSDKNRLSEKAVLRALLGAFNTGDVYVSCTCKDFQFCGFNYLAVKQDYNSNPIFGKAMQPPTIRNPNDDKGAACKHILRVLSDVSWMMNVARVIYNYIKVSRELMQRNYAEIIFPKVYGRPYKGVVQTSLMDKDDMWGDALLQSDRKELDAVIAAAKQGRDVRGRFSQGNPYAFRKRDAQAGPTLSKGGQKDADDSGQPSDMHA